MSIIPIKIGVAKAVGLVIPELDKKLDSFSMCVLTPDGFVVDFTCEFEKSITKEEINEAIMFSLRLHASSAGNI